MIVDSKRMINYDFKSIVHFLVETGNFVVSSTNTIYIHAQFDSVKDFRSIFDAFGRSFYFFGYLTPKWVKNGVFFSFFLNIYWCLYTNIFASSLFVWPFLLVYFLSLSIDMQSTIELYRISNRFFILHKKKSSFRDGTVTTNVLTEFRWSVFNWNDGETFLANKRFDIRVQWMNLNRLFVQANEKKKKKIKFMLFIDYWQHFWSIWMGFIVNLRFVLEPTWSGSHSFKCF